MYNSTDFNHRLSNLFNDDNSNKYLAHLRNDCKEKLSEHSYLVYDYFQKLIKIHKLENTINRLIDDLISNFTAENTDILSNFINSLFYAVPQFHDFGKLNPNFQTVKMNNKDSKKNNNSLGSDHSKIGGFAFIQTFIKEANNPNLRPFEKLINLYILFAFHYPIKQHHSSYLEYKNDYYFDDEFITDIFNVIETEYIFDYSKEIVLRMEAKFNQDILPNRNNRLTDESFSLFALLKLNYSLLTASDYLATSHFMNSWENMQSDFGVFDDKLRRKIVNNIETTTSYNKKTYHELDNYKLDFPQESSGENLNKLRQNLSVETINGIRNNLDKNLFYIEAPTGSGKTNLSMLAIAEFLRNDIETGANYITKVFYVFPFTTLITQTYKSLKETLGLNNDEIVQIHSKSGFSQKGNDDKYGDKKLNIIDYQFVNYPVALLSHIKFFDILKSNKKSENYLMHRLANSIVIIDELQTYSPSEWDKVIYFINKYAKYFDIKFILMSATLPKIDELLSDNSNGFEQEAFIRLNQNKDKYFQNPNFAERIEFDFSMLNNTLFNKNNKNEFLQNLWGKLVSESENYRDISKQNRVHTIIEFIFKKTASEFIEIANERNIFFNKIFILSGTILESRRREIINKLKSDEFKQTNILLITTQVVEAGVDIDMDLGFKDSSLLDSDEQLAGRINRNVKKIKCKLFLFDYDNARIIYGNDYRFRLAKEKLKLEEYRAILQNKKFDELYGLVMEHIAEFNKQEGYTDNLPAYLKLIKNLDFKSVNNEFQLISNSFPTISIFIPVEIPIKISNSCSEKNFTVIELSFLKEKECYSDEEFVSGENVWNLYCDIIENNDSDFTKKKINQVIMLGLISKFTISVGTYSKEFMAITGFGVGEEKYGFYKLNYHDEIYDYETGIIVKELDSAIIF